MNTRHLVDPELLPMLDQFPAMDLRHDNLAEGREAMAALGAGEIPPNVSINWHGAPGADGAPDVGVLVHTPSDTAKGRPDTAKARPDTAKARPGLVYIHGGGFVLGSAAGSTPACAALALEHDCVVMSLDYRLAPETPFPGPIEDCYAALCWVFENATALGIDVGRVAVTGPSAGGGLAAALALAARDRNGPKLCAQILTYPMLDHRTGTDAAPIDNPVAGQLAWTPELNRFGWQAMIGGSDAASRSHLCSPSLAESLAGLPPTFIAVGALDLFVDENIDYARRLMAQGVPTELHVYPGAFHGFDYMAKAGVSLRYRRDFAGAVERAFGAPS